MRGRIARRIARGAAAILVAAGAALAPLQASEPSPADRAELERVRSEYAALSAGEDEAARRAAAAALDRSIGQARARRRAVASRIEVLESGARVQRARLDALREDAPERRTEVCVAVAVQRHLDVQARLRDTLDRYATLLARRFEIERTLRERGIALARAMHDVRVDVVGPTGPGACGRSRTRRSVPGGHPAPASARGPER